MKALALLRRPPRPTVYEVRLEVDSGIVGDFDEWLPAHAREMLAFPGFQAAAIHRALDLSPDGRVVRLAVYEVRSQRELDSYLHTHAQRMRKEGRDRFGAAFSASRRIVAAADYALPDGFAPLYDAQAISGGLPVCGNCHQPVPGRYCMHCGQEDRTFMLSLGELFHDFVGDLFNFDSRVFRTLRPLVLRPGLLTADYIRGRRQHYLPPVRMYIFISLIFFFFVAMLTDQEFGDSLTVDADPDRGPVTITGLEKLSPEERAEVARELGEAERTLGLPEGTLQDAAKDAPQDEDAADGEDDGVNISLGGLGTPELEERLERGARAVKDNPRAFAREVLQQIPTAMLLFLPLIAFVLKLLYIGTGRYYVEHLIFTLHYHSAVFVLLLLWLLFDALQSAWTPLAVLSPWITLALWLYLPYYLYRSQRCVYGQGRAFTLLKFTLLSFVYFVVMFLMLAATLLYTLYLQT